MRSHDRTSPGTAHTASWLRCLAGLTFLGLGVSGALAQSVDCTQLQSQIATGIRGDPAAAARFSAAARKQQYELERTVSYADQIGCNNRQFLFFGSPPPPQCGGLEQQIQRMRGNLATLQAQVQQASGEGQRQALVARYDAYCRQRRGGGGGFFETLFGGGGGGQPSDYPPDSEQVQPAAPEETVARGGPKAVCVRSCDGGFFPVSYSARRSDLGELEELCHALCPNAEAHVFTYTLGGDIEQAVSADGTPYKSLPNALKYRTKYDSTCTCKPANQSWVQALADAEALLGRTGRTDLIVTEQKSEEMSRPQPARASLTTPKGKKPDPKAPVPKPDDDPTVAAEAAANAASPTASNASSGIAGVVKGAKSYGLQDGQKREEVDANGVKRKVRIVGPTL